MDDVRSQLPHGEVVLVDTRQHWVAAIRYALKPLLLVGGVVLLALLNQWLDFGQDSFLSFINTVINWLLVLMLIVAIVWLPIDLAQWYSRSYILTNRRATRSSGILRKQTYGTSLEKINDIGLEQSVFGRALGYADVTFYTASDSTDESWDQLVDGLGFKRAVLEAKEGLRVNAPLTELPSGLVVKGGTNEASMRADGKIKDAPSDGPDTSASGAASTSVRAEDVAGASGDGSKAAPQPQGAAAPPPEVAPEPGVAPEPEVAPGPAADAGSSPDEPATTDKKPG